MHTKDRTWAEVHLDRIAHNYAFFRSLLSKDCLFLAAVKANAYGHGAVPVSRLLSDLGADYLGVACLAEALELREAEIKLPILVLGYTPPVHAPLLARENISQAVLSLEMAQALSQQLRGTGLRLPVHIKLDSGMGRLGFPVRGAEPLDALRVLTLPHLEVQGVFTHYAVADMVEEDAYTLGQLEHFTRAVDWLEGEWGHRFPLRHSSNSGAALRFPQSHLDMVRLGISLYGISPNPGEVDAPALLPAMELKSRISQLRPFEAGLSVSYGRTYQTGPSQIVAAVPLGYADGLSRALSGKIEMLVGGRRVRQIGRICMDTCMLDVSDVKGLSVGDVVTVFGQDGDEIAPVSHLAAVAGTISHELLCAVSPRVPRFYSS